MKQMTLLYLIRGNDILLAMKKRGFGAGRWNGVGGKVEPGESIEQALVRESREEVGITPTHYWQVADIRFIDQEDQPEMQVATYFCDQWDGEPAESEEMAPQWFEKSSIPYSDCWPDDQYWMPLVLEGKLLRASFAFDRNDVLLHQEIEEVKGF